MQYAVRVERVPPTPIAVVRRRAPLAQLPKVVPEACGLVWNTLKSQGVRGGRNLAVYLGLTLDQIDMEIGVELPVSFGGHGEVFVSSLPSGDAATTTHFGPYPQLGRAHQAVRDWINANGRTAAGPNWELYGHWQAQWDNDPSQIRTDVFYLLRS